MMRQGFWAGVLAGALGFAVAAAAPGGGGKVVTVQVLSAKVTKTPSFLAPTVAKVVRGDQLTSIGEDKDWVNVQTKDGQAGWINKSSIVDKAVALSTKPGGGAGGVSDDEVALAGRGFSPEVEAAYKQGHPDLDFSHVDKIEKLDVDGSELAKFVSDGQIKGGGK